MRRLNTWKILPKVNYKKKYLRCGRWIRFLKHGPDLRLDSLPVVQLSRVKTVLADTEPLHNILLGRFIRVEVESVEDLQGLLSVPVTGVRHPTAGFHLVGVKAPEVKFFFEQRTADVGRVVQFARSVVVEDLSKDSRVSIKKELPVYIRK